MGRIGGGRQRHRSNVNRVLIYEIFKKIKISLKIKKINLGSK